MRRCSSPMITTVICCFVLSPSVAVQAQTDAEVALQKARAAFALQDFETAVQQAEIASQTDGDNPDIHLLLGRSYLQLGRVNQATAALRRVLELAPNHELAAALIEALEQRSVETGQKLQLARRLIDAGLSRGAVKELEQLRRRPGLTQNQLQELYALWCEALVENRLPQEALPKLNELVSLWPEMASEPAIRLLQARAQIDSGENDLVVIGVAALKSIIEEVPDSPEAENSRLELLAHRLAQGEHIVTELAAWIQRQDESRHQRRAHEIVNSAVPIYLASSARQPDADDEAPLNDDDLAAIAAAQIAIRNSAHSDQLAMIQRVTSHMENRYLAAGAFETARQGLMPFLEIPMAANARRSLDQAIRGIDESEAAAEYHTIVAGISAGKTQPQAIEDWIAAHPEHHLLPDARKTLINACLTASLHEQTVSSDSQLTDYDRKAIAAARILIDASGSQKVTDAVVDQLIAHLTAQYLEQGAYTAAIEGLQLIVPLQSVSSQAPLLHRILDTQIDFAVIDLKRNVSAGLIPPMSERWPATIQAAVTTAQGINNRFPSSPAWGKLNGLAQQILEATSSVPWPTQVTRPKAGHSWALDLAVLVLSHRTDRDIEASALAVVDSVVNELSVVTQPSAQRLSIEAVQAIIKVVQKERQIWPMLALRYAELLMADSARVFDENVRTGKREDNSRLTEQQEQAIQLLSEVVTLRPSMSNAAMTQLSNHLSRWEAAAYGEIVTSAWQLFAGELSPVVQRRTRLTVAWHRYQQLIHRHQRLLESGFGVPVELEEEAITLLTEAYRLAAETGHDDPISQDVATLREQLFNHYIGLDLFAAAEAAIKVRAAPASNELDEAAELRLAVLRRQIADRELAKSLRRHDGRSRIAVTPAMRTAIAAFRQFVTDHPNSPRVESAIGSLFAIGQTFERHEAWRIAAELYRDLEQFATETDSLNQPSPSAPTVAERAAAARAQALHQRGTSALQKWASERKGDTPVPAQMSDEFRAAITAWEEITANYPLRPVARQAIARMMAIAGEYAAVNAWDVADQVYAGIQQMELPLHSPERLEFGRALCQLGKILPEHSRTVLSALILTEHARASQDDSGIVRELSNPALIAQLNEQSAGEQDASEMNFGTSAGFGGMALGGGIAPGVDAPLSQPGGFVFNAEAATEVADAEAESPRTNAPSASDQMRRGVQFRQESDARLMAAVRSQLDRQAQQIAALRDETIRFGRKPSGGQQSAAQNAVVEGEERQRQAGARRPAVLSEAELARQQEVADVVYTALQAIRNQYPDTQTADQAREEIFVLVNHWREIAQWDRAAQLATRFLADNPADIRLPQIRQEVARDWLAWASMGLRDADLDREELLAEIGRRFDTARQELQEIVAAFPAETAIRQQAQWDIAVSFLTQARVVTASSPTLARGQYVRAARELLQVAELYHDHPQIGEIPNMLANISNELASRGYQEEAITVWNEIQIHYPALPLADQSALRIAQTWQQLGQPLRAVEAYLELNFARGGNDVALQNTIYQIADSLKHEERWIEALHVLQTFVDSFPTHANAGQSLTMIGQIHQENEVWEDAIKAYSRVIDEFPSGAWTIEARWSIAECTINLSLWQEAAGAYAEFQQSYPQDGRVAEAARRIEVLKSLQRFQDVIDEEGQRKAFDAQHQVAAIVHEQLSNPVKAIIEYRKVAQNWPQSHLADDALFEIGRIYLSLEDPELARDAFLQAAERYPESPLADDALLLVGTSYVNEADGLAAVDRGASQARARDIAQKRAYHVAQDNRRRQLEKNSGQIAALKREGRLEEAASKEAYFAGQALQFDAANTLNASNWAVQQEEVISAAQLADRQDKINAALRRAVASFRRAASVTAADKADDALLQMAQIYDERLKDSEAAMSTWEEIVRQYSGTAVAEDASWKMARYYENQKEHKKAISAYQAFFRNYRRSPRAGAAQAAIAENHEHLGEWVQAMDAYANYVNNFPDGPLLQKAREQINWIKTYRL